MSVTKGEMVKAFNVCCEEAVKCGYEDIRNEGWTLTFNRRVRALGLCDYSKKEVQISTCFMATNTLEEMIDTIIHEIAHALCPGENHGKVWRETFISLGGDGQRTAVNAQSAKADHKWEVVDTRTGTVVHKYFRKPKRNISRCQLANDPSSYGKLKLVRAK